MAVTPYVVGQWVRDERFYGRANILAEILDGNRNCLWILGTRRVGKTSILKQLEHQTAGEDPARYFPLFWDFQGCEEVRDLHDGFADALLDAIDRLDQLGIELDAVENDDLFVSMSKLRRELRRRHLTLLLLGDEVEELVNIQEREPRFLRRLRRALQSAEGIRTVFASTIRLWNLANEESTTSPFLHGFTPPLPVRGLSDEAARALVRQSKLPADSRPDLDDLTVETIRERCNNHPYLLQLLGERCLERGNLDQAIEEIATDQMVSFFFGVDLAMVTDSERRILRIIDEQDEATSRSISDRLAIQSTALQGGLQRLEQLGFVKRSVGGEYSLANSFFRRWFSELTTEGTFLPASQRRADGKSRESSQSRTVRTPNPAVRPGSPRGPASTNKQMSRDMVDDRYQLLARLGTGASGEVFKASDTLLRTEIAIKILRSEYSGDEEAIERLRREVVLARDLSHPNILKIYHLGDAAGQRYITMQFVDGPDLAQHISAHAPLPMQRVLELAGKLAAALAALHHCDVLHRDIKPSNVLLDQEGEPRITDFGLARLQWGPGITRHGTFLGTPAYASPEQAQGEHLDERSDLYALGVVIFEMITGCRPFTADSPHQLLMKHIQAQPPVPSSLVPSVPPELSNLILRCLEKKRDERFQSAARLHEALEQLRT